MKKKILVFLFAIFFIFVSAGWTTTTVFDFEDLYPGYNNYDFLPEGYFGANIQQSPSWGWITKDLYPGSGYDYGTIGTTSAFSAFSDDLWLKITDDSTFDFAGCYLTAAWNEDLVIQARGLLDGFDIFNVITVVGPYAPTWFSFNFSGIDELIFSSSGGIDAGLGGSGGHFVPDNLTLGKIEPIPEPATMLLLGSGLIGMAGFSRKKFKK